MRSGAQHSMAIVVQDALSKTIPIWAATINLAVHQHQFMHGQATPPGSKTAASYKPEASLDRAALDWDTRLHSPLFITSTERASIEERLPGFAAQLWQACGGSLPECLLQLEKPLRPLWISQTSHIVTNRVAQPPELSFHPVVLVSASLPALYLRKMIRLPDADLGSQAIWKGTYMCFPVQRVLPCLWFTCCTCCHVLTNREKQTTRAQLPHCHPLSASLPAPLSLQVLQVISNTIACSGCSVSNLEVHHQIWQSNTYH